MRRSVWVDGSGRLKLDRHAFSIFSKYFDRTLVFMVFFAELFREFKLAIT